ncbi:Putative efflux family transporter protein [Salinisphaera shabanensis E1L3A]|uniref:Efflux family transporter protein n=1 Tax=Salinisphaera shabanensis E1L3A TaxID=1033802 RepID=F7Q622_9GAMM|nr:YccS family putative transporter [Salinisphaera shabanensis]ERJ17746.1 Putative efflux family transporter protein [Salinisphaera shabanensis E1L3A]
MRWHRLQYLIAFDRFADALRVFVALAGVMLYAGLGDNVHELIPLMLGVIAAAIAETDDSWRRRASALAVTLLCFAAAALIVQLLFERAFLFGVALALGPFLLVMMGSASPRYATISNATLLLAVYGMIGRDQHAVADAFWHQPALLVAGAGWYGVLSLLWNALFVHRPVRQALAKLYDALGDYLDCKARLFEPSRGLDIAACRNALAHANARVVGALNDTRLALIDRLDGRRSRSAMDENLRLYLAAQDIHERAASSHHPYSRLTQAFFHSDLMFRAQRLVTAVGMACRERGAALRYQATQGFSRLYTARSEFDAALAYQREREDAPGRELLAVVEELAENLDTLAERVVTSEAPAEQTVERRLQNPAPATFAEGLRRIVVEFTPASARFRHGLRLGLAMLVGYAVLKIVHPEQGYWILLTVMLVCQPDYGATRQRAIQRVGGTVLGLVVGWALLKLFPATEIQLLLTIAAGVTFFATRFRRYVIAAAAISVLVLLAFNQVGNGFDLIVPRLLDTVIGGAIAFAAMRLVLPDWRSRELHQRLADALAADGRYLRAIFAQYQSGKRDDLDYRVARRDAHNADAAVSTHVSSALKDPHGARADSKQALAVLAGAQTLIAHLSTLGAHRQVLSTHAGNTLLEQVAGYIADTLEEAAHALVRGEPMPVDSEHEQSLRDALAAMPLGDIEPQRLISAQLAQLLDELPRLRRVGQALVR